MKNIGKAAFQGCFALKNIDLPEGLETIDQLAFDHNRGLTCSKIEIPSTVKVIGHYKYPTHMFYDCGSSNFTEFEVAEGNQYYKAEDGILYTKDGSTRVSIPRGKTFENNTYIMPDTVTILGELCFNRNYNITKVVISDNLVINEDITEEQIEAGYLNHGNSLSVGIYAYTSVRLYDVKDTNTHYTSGIKVVSRTGESGSAENQGYILTADERELVAVPSKASAWHMLTTNVTKIRKNAFYIWDRDANNNYQTTDGMYSGLVFRINQNTTDIEAGN